MNYSPWTNGYAVGFRCTSPAGAVSYVYLNPSSSDSEGQPNVFVYHGARGDPAEDTALVHIPIGGIPPGLPTESWMDAARDLGADLGDWPVADDGGVTDIERANDLRLRREDEDPDF